MLYLVGGASRSGKSQLVRMLLSEKKIPFFPLDAIMMGCSKKAECFKFNPQDHPEKRSAALWPFTADVINTTTRIHDDYAFEGDYIHPENVVSFKKTYPCHTLRAAFLGYAEIDPEKKLREIRHYSSQCNWTRKLSDAELLEHINTHILYSATLRNQCATHGFSYFEAGDNFPGYLGDVYRYLTINS